MSTMSPRSLAASLVLGAVLLAAAPSPAAEPESAQALYDRGFAAFKAGRFDEACPALEQSYKIEPLLGALFTLAECESRRGRFAAAATRYDEYLRAYAALSPDKQSKQGDRERLARAARAAAGLQVAELTLALPSGAPWDTRVTRDGQHVPVAALGVPALVDPGEHVIVVQVPGGPASEVRVTLAPGEKRGVALDVRPTAAAPGATPPPGAVVPQASAARQPGVIAAGVIAGASAVAGAIFTGLWASKGSSAKTLAGEVPRNAPCPGGGNGATGTCGDLVSALNAQATFGSAAVGAFVAAGAVGAVTVISALVLDGRPSNAAVVVAPSAGPRGGALWLRGSF
jgi:hypothetical protein